MNHPVLSVYMPVYNAERFLEKCLSSILKQSFKDFELIIYDDGSTDLSYEQCKRFADADDRISLSRGDNGNSIYRMNEFLLNAKGDYIGFVDDDDELSFDYFERMLTLLIKNDADCVISSYTCIDEMGKAVSWHSPELIDGEILEGREAVIRFLTTLDFEGFRWNKIYKKSVFTENHIGFENRFPADILGEAQALMSVKKVVLCSSKGYCYRRSSTSEVATVNIGKLNGFLMTFRDTAEEACKRGFEKEGQYYFVWRTVNILFRARKNRDNYDREEWVSFFADFNLKKRLGFSLMEALNVLRQYQNRQTVGAKFLLKTVIVYWLF